MDRAARPLKVSRYYIGPLMPPSGPTIRGRGGPGGAVVRGRKGNKRTASSPAACSGGWPHELRGCWLAWRHHAMRSLHVLSESAIDTVTAAEQRMGQGPCLDRSWAAFGRPTFWLGWCCSQISLLIEAESNQLSRWNSPANVSLHSTVQNFKIGGNHHFNMTLQQLTTFKHTN